MISDKPTHAIVKEALDLRVINALGFATTVGGAPLSDEVRRAMDAAGAVNIEIRALQEWAGGKIAEATGAESGWVTDGAAAGLTLAIAACIAGDDPALADSLPFAPGPPEVIVQRTLHTSYNHALRLAGAKLIEVGYPTRPGVGRTFRWELEAAFTSHTAAVAYSVTDDVGAIPLDVVAEIAHRRHIPVIVDAAAELPPAGNLRQFIAEGADIVAFSGGKALRGPQASGIIAGRKEIINAIRLQVLDMDVDPEIWLAEEGREPHQHGIGRSMKVGKEEIVGLMVALDSFLRTDHDAQARELETWIRDLAADIPNARIQPALNGSFYPRLFIEMSPPAARRLYKILAGNAPSIRVNQEYLASGQVALLPEGVQMSDRIVIEEALEPAVRAALE